ncbi:MAG TPA: hypothetical protein VIO38_15735 [Rariglobus sp.]
MNEKPNPELPDDFEERIRKAYENESRPSPGRRAAVNFLIAAGGLAVAGVVIVPGTTMGASRTGRLEWQRRQAEIARVIETAEPPVGPGER